jgi:hypothetical protein
MSLLINGDCCCGLLYCYDLVIQRWMESVMLLINYDSIVRDGWRENDTVKGNYVVIFLHCGLFYNTASI